MDGYDEEFEMEMEDHELDAMMLDTGVGQGSDEEKNARRQYFQELFRAGMILAAEEVVETNFIKSCRRCVCRNMSANTDTRTLCAVNQHRSVPAHIGANTSLNCFISWKSWFILWSNCVDVIGIAKCGNTNIFLMCALK